MLLNYFKTTRKLVGTLKIRNFKKMWEVIAQEFKKENIDVTPLNCENRWRVLERNYKKYVDNKKQTGAGRRFFEFADEMDDILGKKKNINPTILLSTSTATKLQTPSTSTQAEIVEKEFSPDFSPASSSIINKENITTVTPHRMKSKAATSVKNNVLEKIRLNKLDRHKEKLAFEKEKFEKLYQLEVQKVQLKERKNNLLKDKNNLHIETNKLLLKLTEKNILI